MDPSVSPIDFQASMPQSTKRKRIRNWTAEDRALHREFEKSRREAFSESLMELTDLLPTLKEEPRPSKHVIVDASIAHHHAQQTRCDRVTRALQSLISERDDLLKEVNRLRVLSHPSASVLRQARPIDPAVLGMLAESKLSTADLTGEHGSIDRSSKAHTQMVGQSATEPLPVDSLLAVPGFVDSHSTLHQPKLSYPLNPVESSEWTWEEANKAPRQMLLSPNIMDEPLLWNRHLEIPAATPPQDVPYNTNSLHLVNDSAGFWTHYPNTTPPDDNLPFSSLDTSTLWHQRPSTSNIFPPETGEINIDQIRNSANLFNLDPANLSIPLPNMIGTDPNSSAPLCSN